MSTSGREPEEPEAALARWQQQLERFAHELAEREAAVVAGYAQLTQEVERFTAQVGMMARRRWRLSELGAVTAGSLLAGGILGAVLTLGLRGLVR